MPIQALQTVHLLAPGARVGLVSPSGPLRGESDLEQAIANVRMFGWEPVVGAHVLARRGYLAGDDALRVADLDRFFRDGYVDAIWCIRGGYGLTRIIGALDYPALAQRPRPVLGYSDITALHAAIGRLCGLQSYHAPTARAVIGPFTRNSFERALVFGGDPCGTAHGARTVRSGTARGRLAGGNLAVLTALVGTPYFPELQGAILVLEDVNEAVYKIDRMLQQLRMAGTLDGLAGLAFGQCTGCDLLAEQPLTEGGTVRVLDDVLREVADSMNVPCVAGFPIGHIDEQWTVPLGAMARLDADGLTLTIEEHA